MKNVNILSISLGLISLTFGSLKFVSPFKDWYAKQIKASGLPHASYALGIAGEIIIGIIFLFPFTIRVSDKPKRLLLISANISFCIMMMFAIIVHLIPKVPASVLPLKIKIPFIPLLFLCIAIFNLTQIAKTTGHEFK